MCSRKIHNEIDIFSRELESREKNQINILCLKNITTKITNLIDWFKRRLDIAKERISDLKDRLAEKIA